MSGPASPLTRIKLLTMGDSGVGKSCLVKRYCEGRFVSDYVPTIGIDYGVREWHHNEHTIKVNFWDVGGDPAYYHVRNEFYQDVHAIILVYDVGTRSTFDNLDRWLEEMRNHSGPKYDTETPVVFVVGNKSDTDQRQVTRDEGMSYASTHNYRFVETSCVSGDNVAELFEALFRDVASQLSIK